jgi:hypothetical protein
MLAATIALVASGIVLSAPTANGARLRNHTTVAVSTLTGQLQSAKGPVAGGFVAATGPDGQDGAVSDTNGDFSLTVPNGTYRLAASAPGFIATVVDGVVVTGTTTRDLTLTASGAVLAPAPVFGGGRSDVASGGTPGVFYAMGGGAGQLYRTVDYGGTWTQVTVSRDDPTNGLSESTNLDQVVTSGFPGEVAVDDPSGVFYSTDFGVTWSEMTRPGPGSLYWGHAGSHSVMLWVTTSPYAMYVADMTAASPSFVEMTTPYAPSGQPIAVGNGADQLWLATADSAGTLSVYPLKAQAAPPAAFLTLTGFPTDPIAVGIGGEGATGVPPSGVVVQSATEVAMAIKAPTGATYPSPATDTVSCVPWHPGSLAPGLVTPNTDASYGAASLGNCWVQDAGGTLAVSDAYGNGIGAIDAGYNATDTSSGTDAVVLLPAIEARGPLKLASVDVDGNPKLPATTIGDTVNAGPGTDPASAGISTNGITAPTITDATLGPTGSSQMVMSAQDVGGVASDDGGVSYHFVTDQASVSAAWWQGATGTWMLFGGSADPGGNGVSGVENWTATAPAVTPGNVSGSDPTSLGLSGTQWIDSMAGVPGRDTVFVGSGQALYFGAPEVLVGALTRVTVGSGPSFSSPVAIGSSVITSPVLALDYCPVTGSATSLQDVLLAMTGNQTSVDIYRVTGATGADPVATHIQTLSAAAQDRVALRADCASGTVLAGSGTPNDGLLESTDGGQSFSQVPITISGQIATLGITAVAITPGQPTSIVVGGDGHIVLGGPSGQGWIVSSPNGGLTWTVENDPLTQQNFAGPGIHNLLVTSFGIASSLRPGLRDARSAPSAGDLAAGKDFVAGAGEFQGRLVVGKATSATSITSTTSGARVRQPISVAVQVAGEATGTGKPTPSGKVTVSDGTQGCLASLSGSGGVTKGSCSITEDTAGTYSFTASYPGDVHFAASSTRTTVTVTKAPAALSVTSSADPSFPGRPVTFTATVATGVGLPAPGGTVTFVDGATTLCAAVAVDSGGASCTATLPITPTQTITGTYSGDGNYTGATATDVQHVLHGYWLVARDGGVFAFGAAAFYGSMGGKPLNEPVVGIAGTGDGGGYWLVAADGGIFAFGDAGFYGSTGSLKLNSPVVGMQPTPDGRGYWLVAADGGIFAFGDAGFYGSTGSLQLNAPVVGMVATSDGGGYFLVASDGGVFAFGDARFEGTGGFSSSSPVVGLAATPSGAGYWEATADGGVFAFGDAQSYGSVASVPLTQPIVGIGATSDGGGYWLVASDGGVFALGDAVFDGSTGNLVLNSPMVSLADI